VWATQTEYCDFFWIFETNFYCVLCSIFFCVHQHFANKKPAFEIVVDPSADFYFHRVIKFDFNYFEMRQTLFGLSSTKKIVWIWFACFLQHLFLVVDADSKRCFDLLFKWIIDDKQSVAVVWITPTAPR